MYQVNPFFLSSSTTVRSDKCKVMCILFSVFSGFGTKSPIRVEIE